MPNKVGKLRGGYIDINTCAMDWRNAIKLLHFEDLTPRPEKAVILIYPSLISKQIGIWSQRSGKMTRTD